jgi:hypothetical protein
VRSVIKVACRGLRLWLQCPGCDDLHSVTQDWSWDWSDDDDTDNVTISPSILVRYDVSPPNQHLSTVCHSFVRNGRWEFLSDCSHSLAGQTVEMVPLPDWFVFQDQ